MYTYVVYFLCCDLTIFFSFFFFLQQIFRETNFHGVNHFDEIFSNEQFSFVYLILTEFLGETNQKVSVRGFKRLVLMNFDGNRVILIKCVLDNSTNFADVMAGFRDEIENGDFQIHFQFVSYICKDLLFLLSPLFAQGTFIFHPQRGFLQNLTKIFLIIDDRSRFLSTNARIFYSIFNVWKVTLFLFCFEQKCCFLET